ncbi:hypothetical protein [uncultured Bdellovibrio sp.]|uniref:hypothetical protein n=1 Tax=Bdellovibrio sp. HCB-162 TaxID=3394234 RepID=UPI0025D6798E|nr:hypothetical protein [uncultured Bdellovibrio sp.]
MSKMLGIALASLLFVSHNAKAQEVLTLNGTGLNGKACAVKVVKDGDTLKSVELQGASKIFEILSENGGSYGPDTRISDRGGDEILQVLQENPDLYAKMDKSEALFSDSVTYTFDTAKLPKASDELKGIKMVIKIKLSFDNGQLSEVKVGSKAKALWVATLASSLFECTK